MRLSVIIVNFNVVAALQRCLASLHAQPHLVDIVVVDNASSDGSRSQLHALQGEQRPDGVAFKVVFLAENCGFSAAVNAGAAVATGDTLLLLNPDTELPPDAMARMGQSLDLSTDTWAVGFRQVDRDNFFQLAMGWQPSLPVEALRRTVQRRLNKGARWMAELMDLALRKRREVAWVAGSCLLVRRSAFARVGGFDERFFLYFEDIDFCLRLRRAGGKVVYDPAVTLLHHGGVSASKHAVRAKAAYRDSQVYFWDKHRRRSRLLTACVKSLRRRDARRLQGRGAAKPQAPGP